jgi:hypothetical protein
MRQGNNPRTFRSIFPDRMSLSSTLARLLVKFYKTCAQEFDPPFVSMTRYLSVCLLKPSLSNICLPGRLFPLQDLLDIHK